MTQTLVSVLLDAHSQHSLGLLDLILPLKSKIVCSAALRNIGKAADISGLVSEGSEPVLLLIVD